ncbi:MAG: thioredoxin [Nanoarchaeota archaeon]|nr:thioredoxin [Nanoarchaeota archaeon]
MINIDESNFEDKVLKNSKPVVVDFWAPWCQPCLRFGPIFEELSKSRNEVFVKLNVDEHPRIASQFSVMSIPTIKIFKGGKIMGEVVGSLDKESFSKKIDGILK